MPIRCHPLEGACQAGTALICAGQRLAVFGEVGCRSRPLVVVAQPGFRVSSSRVAPAPATHQDQGDGISTGMIPAPGAVRRPRKSSSSAGRVHEVVALQAEGYPEGRQHILAHGRRAGRPQDDYGWGGSIQAYRFCQHRSGLPPQPTLRAESLDRVEVDLVANHVVGRPGQLVCERPDRDDAVGF